MSTKSNNIKHLAIIMDGNARWAADNHLSIAQGHEKGASNIKTVLSAAIELEIPYLTLYAFSSENWLRSPEEIEVLLKLLSFHLENEVDSLIKNGVKLKIIGALNRLDSDVQKRIKNIEKSTENNNKITLCIAFSYGSKTEIIDACLAIINSGKKDIDEAEFKKYLYDPEMPDVDLLIRTSGVYRISNFLLWQAAYAELYFCKKNWPDFLKNDLIQAIEDYAKRKRTFGTRN